MGASSIETERLIIMPLTYSMVNSVISGDKKGFEKLGIIFNAKWPRQDTIDILNFIKDSMPKNDVASGFHVWIIIKKNDMSIIGDAGFKGEPDDSGNVEIGFGLIDEEQRKGYGYEVASSLINWATHQNNVKVIKADCLINNVGSIKVLMKCGLHETHRDHEYIYWERKTCC